MRREVIAAVLLAGCGSTAPAPTAQTCPPGGGAVCACPDGSDGRETCNATGTGFGACDCSPATGTGGGTPGGTTGRSTTGGGTTGGGTGRSTTPGGTAGHGTTAGGSSGGTGAACQWDFTTPADTGSGSSPTCTVTPGNQRLSVVLERPEGTIGVTVDLINPPPFSLSGPEFSATCSIGDVSCGGFLGVNLPDGGVCQEWGGGLEVVSGPPQWSIEFQNVQCLSAGAYVPPTLNGTISAP